MKIEETLVLIKPDGLRKTHEIILKYEERGLKIKKMFLSDATPEKLAMHYAEHIHKPFYPELEQDMMEDHVFVMIVGGENAIAKVRKINGATNPSEAEAGSIRGDFAIPGQSLSKNLVHASDSYEAAQREMEIWV